MNLRVLYGDYTEDEQRMVSYVPAERLIDLLQHPSPWVRKDASMLLFGMGLDSLTCRECDHDWKNERLRAPLNAMLGDIVIQLDEFYSGNGFSLSFDTQELLPLGGHSHIQYPDDNYDRYANILLEGNYDAVLGLHTGGNEPAILAALQFGVPVNFGYYQYRDVIGKQRKFKIAFDHDYCGEKVLVFDDFLKTGRNMGMAFAFLKQAGAADIVGVANDRVLYYDPVRYGVKELSTDELRWYAPL